MNIIDEYFEKMTNNLSFIELKEDAYIDLKDYKIDNRIPLPMILDTLVVEIQEGNFYEELDIEHLINGIIYTLGADIDFKFKKEYIEILYHYDCKIEDYILYRGLKFAEKENYDTAAIYFRSLVNINKENIGGLFNYALSLENIGTKFIEDGFRDKGNIFLREATNYLETILEIDPKFPLAYYKLGYHYKYFGNFLKANLIWQKYLKIGESIEGIEEIRVQLELIEDDVDFEQGVYYLNIEEYDLALERLLKLMDKYGEWGHLYYLIALCYKGNGQYKEAIEFLEKAIKLDSDNVDIYNELGICFYTLGDLDKALEVFDSGVKINHMDYKIIFNRGMINLELGNIPKAMEDINLAYELNPEEDSIKDQKIELEKYLGL
jgi:tetratricopeptide (TPR) repeat protein